MDITFLELKHCELWSRNENKIWLIIIKFAIVKSSNFHFEYGEYKLKTDLKYQDKS